MLHDELPPAPSFGRPDMGHFDRGRTMADPAATQKNAEMADKQRAVRIHSKAPLCEFGTGNEIFCTKTVQHVYAECVSIRQLLTGGVNR